MLHQLLRFLCRVKRTELLFRPPRSKVWLSTSIISSKDIEKAACRHVPPGLVEVRFLCHEAELGTAAPFVEPIRTISANFLYDDLPNDIGRQPNVMSKSFYGLRSKLLLQ